MMAFTLHFAKDLSTLGTTYYSKRLKWCSNGSLPCVQFMPREFAQLLLRASSDNANFTNDRTVPSPLPPELIDDDLPQH